MSSSLPPFPTEWFSGLKITQPHDPRLPSRSRWPRIAACDHCLWSQRGCLWGMGLQRLRPKGQPLTRCVRPGKPPLLCDIRLWLSLILNISHILSLKMKCPLMSPAGKHISQTAVSLLCVCVF